MRLLPLACALALASAMWASSESPAPAASPPGKGDHTQIWKRAQGACVQAKTSVIERVRGLQRCDVLEKMGRLDDAKRCRAALPVGAGSFQLDRTLPDTPAAFCPSAGDTQEKVTCRSTTFPNGVHVAICCLRTTCCAADSLGNRECRTKGAS